MPIRVVDGSLWQNVTDARIAVDGLWQRPASINAAVSNVWQRVWDYDVTGPGPVTAASADWSNASGNKCVVTWTNPADEDFSHTSLYVNRSGSISGPWTYIANYTGRSTAKTYNDTSVTMSSVTTHAVAGLNTGSPIHYYKLVTYDVLGNTTGASDIIVGSTGAGSTVVRGMLSSPYYVMPTNSRTWRNTVWRSDSTVLDSTGLYERVVQGLSVISGNNYNNYGYYWYDTKRTGVVPTDLGIWLARTDNGYNSTQPNMRLSQAPSSLVAAGSSPTGYSTSANTLGTTLTNSVQASPVTSAFHSVSTTWWTHLMDGSTWKSLLMYTGETTPYQTDTISRNYLVMYSANEGGFGIVGGMLKVLHAG